MSEKNNIFENDLLMRSILESGQEDVPARVWDGVAEGLDKAAGKTVRLRWLRAGVSVAAVAAAVAAVLVLNRPEADVLVPVAMHGDMIAVVEPEAEAVSEPEGGMMTEIPAQTGGAGLLAYVPEAAAKTAMKQEMEQEAETGPIAETVTGPIAETVTRPTEEIDMDVVSETGDTGDAVQPAKKAAEPREYFPDVWEDEKPARKVKTSIVVSGITGASGQAGNRTSTGPLRAPALITTPTETGIEEKKSSSKYGLPVSVGAGVKFEFTPRWSLGVGLNYTWLTRTFNGTYTHVNEAGTVDNSVTSGIRNSQHFIGIPVNAYFNIIDSRHVNFYTYAGGIVEKCIYDKYVILSDPIVHKEPAKGVQLSANIGLGVEFMLTDYLGLYVDPSLRYYFDCGQPKSIRTDQPLMLGAELGFRFRL